MKLSTILGVAILVGSSVPLAGCNEEKVNQANPGNPSVTAATEKGTVATAPLPDSAFKAVITVQNAPTTLKVGEQESLMVKVKNASETAWPARGQADARYLVDLGNHWRGRDNKLLTNDDGRTPLPDDVKPGAEVELPLKITAPAKAGDYDVEIDMVQEYVGWFADKGSKTLILKVKVH